MHLDKLKKFLEKKYQCEIFTDLDQYLTLPANQLYKDLDLIKKDSYPNNYRIFYYVLTPIDSNLIRHLQTTVAALKIPNFFVILISNQKEAKNIIEEIANQLTPDQDPINFIKCSDSLRELTKGQITNLTISETICINAWTNVFVDNAGFTKPCCIYQASNISDIRDVSLRDTINAEPMKTLRQRLLNGEKPNECSQCWTEEANQKTSKRLQDNYRFRHIRKEIDWNQIDHIEPKTLNLKLGNICNLSCRICEPKQSSSFDNEVKQNINLQKFYKSLTVDNSWVQNKESKFWQSMKSSKNSLRLIQFEGAEPLLVKRHFEILDFYIQEGVADNISLHYNTNASIFPELKLETFEKFRDVEFTLSIDNLGKKFEYERYGIDWTTVENNIKRFSQLDRLKYSVNVNSTVSALNLMDMYDVFLYFKKLNIPIEFNILYMPEDMSIAVLTEDTKKYILAKFNSIANEEFQQKIKPVLMYMINTKLNFLHQFIDRNQCLDNSRKQVFSEVYPELYNFTRKHNHGNQTV
jgi:MoaA/NifB/PqqE/SkfB family radical SAM enzyme